MIRHRAVQCFFRERQPLIDFRLLRSGDDEPERLGREAHFGRDFRERRFRFAVLWTKGVAGLVEYWPAKTHYRAADDKNQTRHQHGRALIKALSHYAL